MSGYEPRTPGTRRAVLKAIIKTPNQSGPRQLKAFSPKSKGT